jgi:hypothetical protein
MNPVSFKTIAFLALGVGLGSLSNSLELQGDLAPLAESGVSVERAQYHIAALVALIASGGFFIAAGATLFRKKRS